MKNSKRNLDLIKRTVKAYLSYGEVRLFGSRSRNDSNADSDYDILVITEQRLSPKEKFPVKTSNIIQAQFVSMPNKPLRD